MEGRFKPWCAHCESGIKPLSMRFLFRSQTPAPGIPRGQPLNALFFAAVLGTYLGTCLTGFMPIIRTLVGRSSRTIWEKKIVCTYVHTRFTEYIENSRDDVVDCRGHGQIFFASTRRTVPMPCSISRSPDWVEFPPLLLTQQRQFINNATKSSFASRLRFQSVHVCCRPPHRIAQQCGPPAARRRDGRTRREHE